MAHVFFYAYALTTLTSTLRVRLLYKRHLTTVMNYKKKKRQKQDRIKEFGARKCCVALADVARNNVSAL